MIRTSRKIDLSVGDCQVTGAQFVILDFNFYC